MRKALLLTAVSLLFASFAASGASPSLIQNEYDFAKAAADHGVRDAFLMYLDKQAITLVPQPANAYEVYTKRKPSGTKLAWYPNYALLSSSGDFGVDTGPWTATWIENGKPRDAHGQWLTVWHKSKDGNWCILFDGGVDHARPAKRVIALSRGAKVTELPASGPAPDLETLHGSLERAEALFSDTASGSSQRAGYEALGDPDVRLLEEGKEPVTGLQAVMKVMSVRQGGWQWAPSGGAVSNAGDLAYMYGVIYGVNDDTRKQPLGSYMHVWRHVKDEWKLLIDLELPVPPAKK
ncbi:MAG TPA: hypothetical protein VGV16_10610 [Gammaproteobacteria bacterium]|nr:hypothetical protein [Gammaproteobacteria bacterium]